MQFKWKPKWAIKCTRYAENECALPIRVHCNELRALCLTTNALCRTAEIGAILLKCVLIVYTWPEKRRRGRHCQALPLGLNRRYLCIFVPNFNSEKHYTTKVPLQVTRAQCMMHPTTHRPQSKHTCDSATAYELGTLIELQ